MDRIGRYKIVRELGRGAMGVVYHAIDPNIGRPVAIKTINLASVMKPEEQERLRERLLREARSAGSLSHPGIVTIYDVEQEGDTAYIAMEFVDGPTLDQVMSEAQPLSSERMFSFLGQTSAALDYAHGKGIVHRDIKPANIMVASDGTSKIADFGIAKITASEQFTMTGSIVGTPHYMSPEQVQGQPVDGRSDQFSLAVIAFEMLTGEKPYTGEHLTTVVYKIVAEEPPILHRINPSLSGQIEAVIRKGLSKKPDGRYRTCTEFTEALEKACVATKGWLAMARGGSLNAPTIGGALPAGAVALPPARRPQRESGTGTTQDREAKKSKLVPFALALLVAGGLVGIVWWQTQPSASNRAADKETEQPAPEKKAPPEHAAVTPSKNPEPAVEKPSPLPPVEKKAAAPVPVQSKEPRTPFVPASPATRKSVAAAAPQQVTVLSSPSDARATLDNNIDTVCTTPCSLEARPGRHTIEIAKGGYETVRLPVTVGSSPLELPPVRLRNVGQGTLMVSSDPPGAVVVIDGQRHPGLTPAQVSLAPGKYSVTVEWKDGKQTRMVEVGATITQLRFVRE